MLQRERDEAERRREVAAQQAQMDRDYQQRQYDSLMNQMHIDRDYVRTERDEGEKRRVEAEQQAQRERENQQCVYNRDGDESMTMPLGWCRSERLIRIVEPHLCYVGAIFSICRRPVISHT